MQAAHVLSKGIGEWPSMPVITLGPDEAQKLFSKAVIAIGVILIASALMRAR